MTNCSNVCRGLNRVGGGRRRRGRRVGAAPRRAAGRDELDADARARARRRRRPAAAGRSGRRPTGGSPSGASTTSVAVARPRPVSGSSHWCQVESGTARRSSSRIWRQEAGCSSSVTGARRTPPRCGGEAETRWNGGPGMGPETANIARPRGRVGGRRERSQIARKSARGTGPGLSTGAVDGVSRSCARAGRDRGRRRRLAILSAAARTRRADRPTAYEAHLPAQEAQARPHPRLPCAHEHPRRPHRAQAAPRQGPQAAHRLVSRAPERRAEPEAAPAVAQRRVRAGLPPGPLEGEPLPRAVRVPARGGAADEADGRPAARPVRVAPGRRRRRPHAREARAARGVLGRGRAAAGGLGLRRRRAPGRARARRARGHAGRPRRARRARRRHGRGRGRPTR